MNRFSDGFSDNSYEDLLNEYAGQSLGSKTSKTQEEPVQKNTAPKTVKKTAPTTAPKVVSETTTKAAPMETPVFNIDISHKKKTTDYPLDIDLVKPFEEVSSIKAKPEPVQNSNTMEFSARKTPLYKRYPTAKAEKEKTENSASQNTNRRKASPVAIFIADIIRKIEAKKSSEAFANVAPQIKQKIQLNKNHLIGVACCLVIAIILSSVAISCINDVLAINRDGEESIQVVLPNDADTSDAVKVLDEAGLIKNRLFCNMFLKIVGKSDKGYLPGVYYLTADLGVEKMIDRFKTSSTRGATISVTIPEGYTIDQIFERLEKNDICTSKDLYKTIDEIDFSEEYSFIAKIDNPEERYHVLEGYMFPATYEFEQGADPATVIRKFLDAFSNRWTDEYAARATELGMSVDDIIKLASIIEKEGANHEQFGLVSSVLHNRLNRSGLYPTLDCDSTKDYVTNTISQQITSSSKINNYILAYSTYECAGLPAGAICNPGVAAIEAALHPDTTQYYFFAHDNNKKIYMASTVEEQDRNWRTIQKVNAEEN